MASKIQLRRDTAANWTSTNPVLAQGEPGVELDSKKLKIGDGTSTWTALPYASGGGDAGSLVYKGATDITAAPPAGPKAGWTYIASPGGTANAGWTGLTGNIPAGTTIFYSGAAWALLGSAPVPDLWSRTGTEITPKTAGDSVFTSGAVKVGGTTAAPNITVKADGGIVANTNGLVYDAATKRLAIGTISPEEKLTITDGVIRLNSTTATSKLLIFYDTAGLRHIIGSDATAGTNELGIRSEGQIVFGAGSGRGEAARIDSSKRLLVGTSSTSANGAQLQVVSGVEGIDVLRYGNNAAGTNIVLYKTRGATNVHGVVSANDSLGQVTFSGSDGANYIAGASIRTEVDGTPGTNDMPGRLVFSTCPDNSASPVERLRIKSNGAVSFFLGGSIKGEIYGGSYYDPVNAAGIQIANSTGTGRSLCAVNGSGSLTDNYMNLGDPATRWGTVYAATGTINTSDANLKQDIEDLDSIELAVAQGVKSLIKKFRFKDAVEKKGDNARIHVGVIAQEVEQVFVDAGLDPRRYALFCEDELKDGTKRLGIRYDELLAFVVAAL